MKKQLFYFVILIIFSFSIFACQSARETNVSVNSSKTTEQPNKSGAGQDESKNSPDKSSANIRDDGNIAKNTKTDSAEKTSSGDIENRCGWYSNPTPGNHWLDDKDGEWIIGVQGGHQAKGNYPPEFSDDQWVKTNINYGYGCACLRVKTDKKNKEVTEVISATAKPLAVCRDDKALKEPKE